jgi:hypothetical protein
VSLSQNLKLHATLGEGGGAKHYLEEKVGTFSIAFLKELAPFSFLLQYKIAE